MPAGNTYEAIASATITSSGSGFDFQNIPGTYTDLRLIVSSRGTFASQSFGGSARFNGDSGNNYSWTRLFSDGSAQSQRSTDQNTANFGELPAANATSGIFGTVTIDFLNYSNTTTFKNYISRTSTIVSTSYVFTYIGLWRSTSAITRIQFGQSSIADLAVGSTATLYGIKAA